MTEWKVVRTDGARHGLHATLTAATCGLWAPVWFLAWVFQKKRKVAVPR